MSPSSSIPQGSGILPWMKLFVVTRQDLSPGAQAVQSCHALMQFSCDHPDVGKTWFEQSNTLALLAVPDENALKKLLISAQGIGVRVSMFCEPDMKNQLTAIILEPSPKTKRLVAKLPLALGSR